MLHIYRSQTVHNPEISQVLLSTEALNIWLTKLFILFATFCKIRAVFRAKY